MKDEYRNALLAGQRVGSRYKLSLPRRVMTGTVGAQAGRGIGSSLEFMDHREYQPGDDLRRIDWGAYARSDKLIVKMYREEINPHLDLILDGSRSLDLADSHKAEGALALAALLAEAAGRAGYSRSVWLTGADCQPVANCSERAESWDRIEFTGSVNPSDALLRTGAVWRPRGVRILISDLLWMAEPLSVLSRLAENATAVCVVQMLARDDVDPTFQGNLRLADSESDEVQEVFIDAAARRRYQHRLRQHQQNWDRACRQTGAILITLTAEDLLDKWNVNDLVAAEMLEIN